MDKFCLVAIMMFTIQRDIVDYSVVDYNRLLIAKRGNIGMIHIIVCEDSDMFI